LNHGLARSQADGRGQSGTTTLWARSQAKAVPRRSICVRSIGDELLSLSVITGSRGVGDATRLQTDLENALNAAQTREASTLAVSMKHWVRPDWSRSTVFTCALAVALVAPRMAGAQESGQCSTDRLLSTLVGAGLGAAAGAIPATVVHRHDQTSSHRIVAGAISAGALIGFLAAGRDHPCASHSDPARADEVLATRSGHAGHGALVGAVIGGVVGAAASTLYSVGCTRDPCDANRQRVYIGLFSAGEGALAGGILGSLIGWAWPVKR